ncbi:MAG: oleate hydratase [bacterium]|nr:oleate hydratase [bacterium]
MKSEKLDPNRRKIYLVGGGIASLSAAVFAIRDGRVPGGNISVFEALDVPGGCLDGAVSPGGFFTARGARKYDLKVFNCTWDLFSAVPSLADPSRTLGEEFREFNRTHRKNSAARLVDRDRNKEVTTLGLGWGDRLRLFALVPAPETLIENRRIDSWFAPAFFRSAFWYIFASTFGFEPGSDLAECRRFILRFLHVRKDGEVVTPYNQYDSMVRPIVKWLGEQGVNFLLGCRVTDLDFRPDPDRLTVERIHYLARGEAREIAVRGEDLVFVTNGSMAADSRSGSMTAPAPLETGKLDGSWTLWENLARKRPGLGNPRVFSDHVGETRWVTFFVTARDPVFLELHERFTGTRPGEADLVTFKDSGWLLSVHVPYQPHFIGQPGGVTVWGGYGLVADREGDYVGKKMSECSGAEILTEVCRQFGFERELPRILETSTCVPSLLPYACAQFRPRKRGDRPPVVPPGSTNLAFLGQFTESGECVFLVESSVRSGQMAVYSLLRPDLKVPPVYSGLFDPQVWSRALGTFFR